MDLPMCNRTSLWPGRLRHAVAAAVLSFSLYAQALIVAPYSLDASTLHLWHLDENAAPAIDSAPGGTNLTALGGAASLGNISLAGFGQCLNTATTTGDYLAPRTLVSGTADDTAMTYADATTGAFTIEGIVRVDFNPATFNRGNLPLYLIMGENDAGDRPWQFRIHTNGVTGSGILHLQFLNLGVGNTPYFAVLPTYGPNTIASGNWYHVAVTYDGPAAGGNLKFYWTLVDSSRMQANLIGTAAMPNLTPLASGNIDFAIGNVPRNTPNANWIGRIDEVRISKIARSASDMLFSTTNVIILTPPASQTVAAGAALNLGVTASGVRPLFYLWRYNGVPIAGANLSTYSIATAQLADWGNYDVVVTNSVSAATSAVAVVNVATTDPVTLRITEAPPDFLLSWPISTVEWTLQSAFSLAPTIFWQNVTNPVVVSGNEKTVIVPDASQQKYFRLHANLPPPPTNAVFPIDWSLFPAGLPNDTNAQLIIPILRNACEYAMTTWWDTARNYDSQDATNYLWLGGTGESNVRAPAMEAYGLAVALQTGVYDAAQVGVTSSNAMSRTVKMIRSVGYRHLINSPGGWGSVWQSAHWAALTGTAGWLLWTNLAPVDQEYVRRMVEYEANRFTNYFVPYYQNRSGTIVYPGDTKAEENAWNASVLHLAVNMMPGHSNAALWRNKALELTLSTHARPSDINRTNVYHGRTLASWLNGSNANEDSTVINHSIVHPDYMVAGLGEFQPALVYLLGGKPVPLASFFNVDLMYAAMVDLNFVAGTTPYPVGGAIRSPGGYFYMRGGANQPTGDMYFPQGNDWGTMRRIHVATLDCTVRAFGLDGLASIPADQWEIQHNLMVLQMQGRFTDGRTYGASAEDTYSLREEWVCNYAAKSLLTKWLVHQNPVQVSNAP